MLKQRVMTAVLLIALVLAAVFVLPVAGFGLITAIVLVLATWEWCHIIGLHYRGQKIFYLLILLWCVLGAAIVPAQRTLWVGVIWWLFGATYCVLNFGKNRFKAESILFKALAGILTLVPCWIGLNALRAQNNGAELILILFALIWAADIGAYFAGKRYGKHPLLKKVSPGKTIEGSLAGMICVFIVSIITAFFVAQGLTQWLEWIVLALITGLVSILGDLFESMLKRGQGIKDSGNWLPGHGGLLDRIDSLTAASPVFALGVLLLGFGG